MNRARFIPMGPFPITVAVVSSKKVFDAERKRLKLPPASFIDDSAGAQCRITSGGLVFVCVEKPKRFTSEFVETVAHEASHVAEFCWEYMTEEKPGDEVRAYLIGYLTRSILEAVWGNK